MVAISAAASGWSERAEGLTNNDTALTAEVSIQAQISDVASRFVDLGNLTVFGGVCDDNVVPNLR